MTSPPVSPAARASGSSASIRSDRGDAVLHGLPLRRSDPAGQARRVELSPGTGAICRPATSARWRSSPASSVTAAGPAFAVSAASGAPTRGC